jgi:signal peptidase I
MEKIKRVILLLLSLTPGVGFAAVSDWKRMASAFGVFLLAGTMHSAIASNGASFFPVGIATVSAIWALILWISIPVLLRSHATASVWKALIATVLFVVLSKSARQFLFVGVPYRMQSTSMTPLIEKDEHFFASKLGREYVNGNQLVLEVNGAIIVGILCGKAGESVEIRNGTAFIDGKTSDCLNGVSRDASGDMSAGGVPIDHVFVLNNGMLDSSRVGPVKLSAIKGRVLYKIRDVPGGEFFDSIMGWLEPL